MDELIARIERATEGSRELDMAIHKAVTENYNQHDTIPAYTDYIDAALTLVPEGWGCRLSTWSGVAHVDKSRSAQVSFTAAAPSIPLALCIAALKARQSNEG